MKLTKRTALGGALLIVATSCGGGPSLAEYVAEGEELVVTMNAGLDELDDELQAGAGSVAELIAHWDARVRLRRDFVVAFGELTPPSEMSVFHEAASAVMARVLAAEEAYAAAVREAESLTDISEIDAGPLGQAFRTADEEGIAICRAANDQLAETESRALFQDVLWVPGEMKDVVRVALQCTADERTRGR